MRCGNDPMSDVLPSLDNFHVENHKSKSFWRWPRTKDVCFPYGSDLRVFSFYLQSFLADIVFPVWPTVVFCRISLWDHHLIHQHCLEGVRSPTSCPGKRVNGQSQSPDLCYKIAVYHIGKHNCCYVIIGRFIYPAVYIYIYISVYIVGQVLRRYFVVFRLILLLIVRNISIYYVRYGLKFIVYYNTYSLYTVKQKKKIDIIFCKRILYSWCIE